MSSQAMPFLYLNMGGEMAYILEQRLEAQNIGDEKSIKVLCDIVTVMLNKGFLDELFDAQEMYTKQRLRQFFEQIAHSSVMRLNEASMDKLFDLMTMAVKYQFLLCKEPSELVLVTMNHLDGMKAIFKEHPDIIEHIDYASTLLMDHFGDTPLWQMAVIRSELLNFLMGSKVKVSLMLREHRQLEDGRFVLFPAGEQIELPYNAVVPGTVRYVENGALVRSEQFPVDEQFKVSPDFYQDRTMIRGTTLGQNMYRTGNEGTAMQARETLDVMPQQVSPQQQQPQATSGGDELELLSMLIKGDKSKQFSDGFELELFEQENNAGSDEKKQGTTSKKPGKQASTGGKRTTPLSKAMKEMSLDKEEAAQIGAEKPPSRKGSRKGKQLLEMMDQQSAKTKPEKPKAEAAPRKRSGSAAKRTASRGGT